MCVFLNKTSHRMLESTGMRNIIENAIFPTLMFLPNLTPEADSVALLRPAYKALLLLARTIPENQQIKARQALDKILRQGIVVGYHHAPQSPRVVEVLMEFAATTVQHLGLFAIKHLQVQWTAPRLASILVSNKICAEPSHGLLIHHAGSFLPGISTGFVDNHERLKCYTGQLLAKDICSGTH